MTTPMSPDARPAPELEDFRREVRDKLGVAFHHGHHTYGTRKGNVLEQCEAFLTSTDSPSEGSVSPTQEEARESAEWIEKHCRERDTKTEHDQEWNWLLSHASKVTAYFAAHRGADQP